MNIVFFDERCKLCINTVSFLKKYVNPRDLKFEAVSNSNLSSNDKEAALKDMLLISDLGHKFWGYKTYIKIFSLSNSKFSILFINLSRIMLLPFVSILGKKIYDFVSSRRSRCDDDCLI
tara:strand:+ start:1336 stop:1692 length:357 start_codon:yes stop_codon:yes gene_type:complete